MWACPVPFGIHRFCQPSLSQLFSAPSFFFFHVGKRFRSRFTALQVQDFPTLTAEFFWGGCFRFRPRGTVRQLHSFFPLELGPMVFVFRLTHPGSFPTTPATGPVLQITSPPLSWDPSFPFFPPVTRSGPPFFHLESALCCPPPLGRQVCFPSGRV